MFYLIIKGSYDVEENNSKTVSITVRCQHCNYKFKSGIWINNRKSFEGSNFFNNLQNCPACGEMTACNKENFIARFEDGGFIGKDS
ncbi:hypothetical protein EYY83_01580 [Hafnia alvei]|nr:hypothetical protein PU01_21275 [Hafnia alvei]TBM20347.1 hypothetical protein EYY83_01580 [Hafnia alvei]